MSHTTTIQTQFKDEAAIRAACKELGFTVETGKARLYDGSEHAGLIVRLPGWNYPVIVDKKTGAARYDNYKGNWGDAKLLEKFKQTYAVCLSEQWARRHGKTVRRVAGKNGAVQLRIGA